MHLSIVHKEVVDTKEEPTSNNFKEEPDKTSTEILLQCEICSSMVRHRIESSKRVVDGFRD